MPELAEVELGRKLAAAVCTGRTIAKVRCADDRIVFDGVTPAQVRRALTGRTVLGAKRWGKYLWLELDQPPMPVMHFGMTGALRVPDVAGLPLAAAPKPRDDGWPPKFWKLHLQLDDGSEIALTNARRLGRVRLRDDPRGEPPIRDLGFDPLLAPPRLPAFVELLSRRSGPLKGVLLDQKFAAGVGNWIADEVLYQSRLAPLRAARDLDRAEARRLLAAIKRVVRRAVAVDADSGRFPRTWLFHHRWGKNREATIGGHPIEFIEVAGRTTAWVPAVQGGRS